MVGNLYSSTLEKVNGINNGLLYIQVIRSCPLRVILTLINEYVDNAIEYN